MHVKSCDIEMDDDPSSSIDGARRSSGRHPRLLIVPFILIVLLLSVAGILFVSLNALPLLQRFLVFSSLLLSLFLIGCLFGGRKGLPLLTGKLADCCRDPDCWVFS